MLRIGGQFEEAWNAHSRQPWKSQGLDKASQLLREVDLNPDEMLRRYPREVSLGQAQRVLIAMSLLHDPKLLLADEPTSALDVIVQKEVLDLIRRMTASRRMATVFISHDLLSVATLCDRVAILHQGAIVECAATRDIFANPKHPYSQKLIGALPVRPQFAPVDTSSLAALAESTGFAGQPVPQHVSATSIR
jgi:ABC-type dipeptide/oligopeptide/nickel transport system ATPase component